MVKSALGWPVINRSQEADLPYSQVYKPGKVAIVLTGRQAGKKVVVIRQVDEGTKERPYPHAIVAGIERYPLKVNKRMGEKKIKSRSRVKPFIKVRVSFTSLRWFDVVSQVFSALYRPSITPISSPLGTHSNSKA